MAKLLDFTVDKITALPNSTSPSGRDEYRDTKVAGLYLRVTRTGAKSFSYVGRAKGREPERVTFGKFPQVKPDEARRRAKQLGGQAAAGVSPGAASRSLRGEMTLDEVWKLYYEYISKTNKDPASTEQVWRLYVQPQWGRRRLSDISALAVEKWFLNLPDAILKRRADKARELQRKKDAVRAEIAERQAVRRHGPDPKAKPKDSPVLAKKVTGRGTANKALEVLRALFNYAKDAKRMYFAGVNPATGHQAFVVHDRERFIEPDEMPNFFLSLAQEENETVRDAILIALLTGQRRANVLAMKWSEVNLRRAEWKIAAELMKNNEPHTAVLVPEAVELLRRRSEAKASEVWVFPSEKSKTGHIGDPKTTWRRVLKRAGIPNLIPHDLRRTNGSWQARDGASLVLIGKSLAHKSPEATEIYARLDMDPVRRSMNSATSAMFAAAGVKPTAEVVPIDAARQSSGKQVAGKS